MWSESPERAERTCRNDADHPNRGRAGENRNSATAVSDSREQIESNRHTPRPAHHPETAPLRAQMNNAVLWRERRPPSRNKLATRRACTDGRETQRRIDGKRVCAVRHRASPKMS